MDFVILHVTISGEPGKAKAFAEEVMRCGLRDEVLAEEGCLQYDYFTPVGDDGSIMLLEKWRDRACLDAHTNGEPMKKLKAVQAPYQLTSQLEIFA